MARGSGQGQGHGECENVLPFQFSVFSALHVCLGL